MKKRRSRGRWWWSPRMTILPLMILLGVVLMVMSYRRSIHHRLPQRDATQLDLRGGGALSDAQRDVSTETCPKTCPPQYLASSSHYICCNRGRCSKAITDCPPPYGTCLYCTVDVTKTGAPPPATPKPMVSSGSCGMPTSARVGGSTNIGNDMSAYWHALGVAVVTARPFHAQATMGGSTFTGYLPTQWHPPHGWHGDAEKAAAACHCSRPQYAHECLGAWTEARGLIRDFMNDSLHRAGLAQRALADTLPDELFVHQRCAWETLLLHGMYGPMSFSVFREAVKTTTTRVTFIEGKAGDSWLCDKIRESIQAFIRMDHPSVSFRVLLGDTKPASISMDFARLVYAPILVRGPSSFNLWAALANHGQVYSPPNPPTWGWTTTELGSDWHWVTSARVLTRAVAKKELKLKRPLEKKPRKEGEPTWTDLFLERAIPWLNEDPIWFHHASP